MMNRKTVKRTRRLCLLAVAVTVVFELPKWALIAAMIPASVLMAHCVLTILGRR